MDNILLVEDDTTLALGLEYTLKNEGFNVIISKDLKSARESFNEDIDLILLDVTLPDGNGYEFCKEIRNKSNLPIIFLTACDEEVNIVLGLDIGADDYITKPFRIRELISRIKALLRRAKKEEKKEEKVLSSGDITIDVLQCKVEKGGETIMLTSLEYKLLLNFVNNSKQVLSRNTILEGLWDIDDNFIDDNTLSVYIRRLREKIEDNPAKPKYICTVRGIGYKWDKEVGRKL